MSWLITSETVRNATTNALIRETTFSYTVMNGKVLQVEMASYDSQLIYQGSEIYTYESDLKYSMTTVLNCTRSVMKKVKTFYNTAGEPVRSDTYLGNSTTVNCTTYSSYDPSGNIIFTQDAMGGQTYIAYVNGSVASSYGGGDTLTRTSTGLLFFDSFDTLDVSDWIRDMGDGRNSFAVGADPNSVAVEITRVNTGGNATLTHTFTAQTGNFYIEASFMSNQDYYGYFDAMSGSTIESRARRVQRLSSVLWYGR